MHTETCKNGLSHRCLWAYVFFSPLSTTHFQALSLNYKIPPEQITNKYIATTPLSLLLCFSISLSLLVVVCPNCMSGLICTGRCVTCVCVFMASFALQVHAWSVCPPLSLSESSLANGLCLPSPATSLLPSLALLTENYLRNTILEVPFCCVD